METFVVNDGMVINTGMDEFEKYKMERKKRAEQRRVKNLLILIHNDIQEIKNELSEVKFLLKGRIE